MFLIGVLLWDHIEALSLREETSKQLTFEKYNTMKQKSARRATIPSSPPAPSPGPRRGVWEKDLEVGVGVGAEREGWKRRDASVPSSTLWTKAVHDGRLVGTVPAFVLPDICYTSPAASWRLRLTACGNNARLSDPLSSL